MYAIAQTTPYRPTIVHVLLFSEKPSMNRITPIFFGLIIMGATGVASIFGGIALLLFFLALGVAAIADRAFELRHR